MSRTLAVTLTAALLSAGPALGQEPGHAGGEERIAAGVAIEGVDVSGLTAAGAADRLESELLPLRRSPLAVHFNDRRFAIRPAAVGYRADVDYTLRVALLYGRGKDVGDGVNVRLRQRVDAKRLRAVLRRRAVRHRRPPRDARFLAGRTPRIVPSRPGRALKLRGAERVVTRALTNRTRPARWRLPTKPIRPAVPRIPSAVIVDRTAFKLHLLRGGKLTTFGIAVGQIGHETPAGRFNIVTKQRNPWWYPPPSPWASGLSAVPPGPANPLGTRWMGLTARFIGIHGTPASGSIGSRASHGCIRMKIADAEYVFDRVTVGTPVVVR